jgi:hypothetical protein
MDYPYTFSEAELLAAFRSVLTEDDAQELASDAAAAIAAQAVITFSEETLILLSLLGPEANRKVEAYRTWRRQGQPVGAEEERQWQALTQTMKQSMKENGARSPDAG